MTYQYLTTLKNNHIAIQILNADNFAINQSFNELKFPKSAKFYLDDFINQKSNYLIKSFVDAQWMNKYASN
jgi:hypothetical protein